jgi:hypothetical protein
VVISIFNLGVLAFLSDIILKTTSHSVYVLEDANYHTTKQQKNQPKTPNNTNTQRSDNTRNISRLRISQMRISSHLHV